MYYIVSLPDSNGLEILSPYIYLERNGELSGYINYSPRKNLVQGFNGFDMALIEAYEIYKNISSIVDGGHTELAKGLYVLDDKSNKMSINLSDCFINGDNCLDKIEYLKGDINV